METDMPKVSSGVSEKTTNSFMSYEQAKKEIEESSPYFSKKKTSGIELPFEFNEPKNQPKIQQITQPFQGELTVLTDDTKQNRVKHTDDDMQKILKDYPDLYFEKR